MSCASQTEDKYYNLSVTCDTCIVHARTTMDSINSAYTNYDTVIGNASIDYPISDSIIITIDEWVANSATYNLTLQPSNTSLRSGTRGGNIWIEYH